MPSAPRPLAFLLLLSLALLLCAPLGRALPLPAAGGPLRVVTTIPDLEDLVREIGGERVSVQSIARGRENIHFVPVRPSALIAIQKAEVFVQVGLSLEHGWIPGILLAARNKRIDPSQPGFVNVSDGWEELLTIPPTMSRDWSADIHPQGNPHINLHPGAGRHFASRILRHLVLVDPDSREHYERRHAAYLTRLGEAEARWKGWGEKLRGRKVVMYHQDLDYFCAANGIEIVGTLEPRPGIAPTPSHLAELIERMRAEEVRVILTGAWSNNRHTRRLAEQSGAAVLEVPLMVGGVEGAESWIAMIDWLYRHLARALAVELNG